MERVRFRKGQQRKFLKDVLKILNCPSLKELQNRGFDISYSTLKNYFSEQRNLPENLFEELLEISKIKKENLDFEFVEENYGQIIGGRKSKR